MTKPEDNAFPWDDVGPHPGLTKREYFAAMAMQGMLSNPAYRTNCDKIAEWALQHAGALIAELSKGEE